MITEEKVNREGNLQVGEALSKPCQPLGIMEFLTLLVCSKGCMSQVMIGEKRQNNLGEWKKARSSIRAWMMNILYFKLDIYDIVSY